MENSFPSLLPTSLPNESVPLRPFLENIIEKKVNKIALTIFEKIADILCSYFYKAYRERLKYAKEVRLIEQPLTLIQQVEKHFSDDTILYDRTHNQRVSIEAFEIIYQNKKIYDSVQEIVIDGNAVVFSSDASKKYFARIVGTKKVVVMDHEDFPKFVIIYELEYEGNYNAWIVNTDHPISLDYKYKDTVVQTRNVLLADSISSEAKKKHGTWQLDV